MCRSISNFSLTKDSKRRKEFSNIRRCRLRSGLPACFDQNASQCRRWSNIEGDRSLLFFLLFFFDLSSSNEEVVAVSLATKDANVPPAIFIAAKNWLLLWIVRKILQLLSLPRSRICKKDFVKHELMVSTSLRDHSDPFEPITPTHSKIWVAGVMSLEALRKFFEFVLTLQLFLRDLRTSAKNKAR